MSRMTESQAKTIIDETESPEQVAA
jgi:hypothetical protein